MITIEELYRIFEQHPAISTDSRKIIPDSIFFALRGKTFDGNKFADEALQQCAFAVVDNPAFATNNRCILVDNTLTTLQQLAAFHRLKLNTNIIAITGSNGKTTTKELIARALSKHFNVVATEGNLNNHIGVPLTLLKMTHETDFGIVEMGANAIGEIDLLCQISRPDCGLITNVGKAHLEGFGSFEGVKKAKAELYQFLYKNNGFAFVNADNQVLEDMSPPRKSILYGIQKFTHCQGKLEKSDLYVNFRWISTDRMFYDEEPQWHDENHHIQSKLYGFYNFENMLAAVCVADYFGVPAADIKSALESYIPSNNRSQIIKTSKNTLIIDSYNANPSSMTAAITNFAQIELNPKCLIAGDMLELGNYSAAEHKAIFDLITEQNFSKVFMVGKHFKALNTNTVEIFTHSDELAQYLSENPLTGYTILLKGSRGIALEKVITAL